MRRVISNAWTTSSAADNIDHRKQRVPINLFCVIRQFATLLRGRIALTSLTVYNTSGPRWVLCQRLGFSGWLIIVHISCFTLARSFVYVCLVFNSLCICVLSLFNYLVVKGDWKSLIFCDLQYKYLRILMKRSQSLIADVRSEFPSADRIRIYISYYICIKHNGIRIYNLSIRIWRDLCLC